MYGKCIKELMTKEYRLGSDTDGGTRASLNNVKAILGNICFAILLVIILRGSIGAKCSHSKY